MGKKRAKRRDAKWLRRSAKEKHKRVGTERITIPGFGSITRTGRLVVLESHRTAEEQHELVKRLAAAHPEVEAEIQGIVDALAKTVPRFDPLTILHRAYCDFFTGMLGKEGEHEVEFSGMIDVRMLDYLHSIIVSRPTMERADLDDDAWMALRGHVERLYELLLTRWPSTYSAFQQLAAQTGGDSDDDIDSFRIPLLMQWMSVRGSRYTVHERERAQRLLEPHNGVLQSMFSTDAEAVAKALEEIQRRLTLGIGEAMQTIKEIHAQTFAHRVPQDLELANGDTRDLLIALVERTGRREELESASEEAFGLALFDITELLPTSLLRAISLEAGEDSVFFGQQPHAGWPLRTPPTARRPVLRVDDRYYVFNPFATDNFYRAIELAVVSKDPTARQLWNEGQKEATEALPVELLRSMLPHATIYRDVEYPFPDAGGTKWCECDTVVVLDGMLLAIEVKGGRASDSSPLYDTDNQIRSVQRLLLAPAKQADRFIEYVQGAAEVALYDSKRTEIGRLQRAQIDLYVRCAITADSMASVAGLFQHEPVTTFGESVPRTWCISIDDLFAYRDVLRQPTWFRHFLTYRLRAFDMSELAPLDELDHLGVYLATNAYVDWIKEIGCDMIGLHGYRAKLDQYFGRQWLTGDVSTPPTQPLPVLFCDLIKMLEKRRPRGYLRAGGALLDLDGDTRESLASMVVEARRGLNNERRSRVVCPFFKGEGNRVFIAVSSEGDRASANRASHAEHAMSQMVVADSPEGVLIEVSISRTGKVRDVGCVFLSLEGISEARRRRLSAVAREIAAVRFKKAAADGVKIGRNDSCLCGSGLKYKKCCRNQ